MDPRACPLAPTSRPPGFRFIAMGSTTTPIAWRCGATRKRPRHIGGTPSNARGILGAPVARRWALGVARLRIVDHPRPRDGAVRGRCGVQAIPARPRSVMGRNAGNGLGAGALGARTGFCDRGGARRAGVGRGPVRLAFGAVHDRHGERGLVACCLARWAFPSCPAPPTKTSRSPCSAARRLRSPTSQRKIPCHALGVVVDYITQTAIGIGQADEWEGGVMVTPFALASGGRAAW